LLEVPMVYSILLSIWFIVIDIEMNF